MKKIFLLLLTVPLLLASCSKDPYSDFTVSSSTVGIGENVYFTNRSLDAESFEWDFGDGYVSTSFNSSHYFDYDGIYTVRLKAFRKNKVDISTLTITVIDASIEITVEEYYEPYYLVPDISVILYPSVADWQNETNMIEERFTNANGVVRFDHLAAKRYYVDIWGPNHDNYQLAAEDVGFIETPVLIPGTITSWTALVDYYPNGKKSLLSRFETKAQRMLESQAATTKRSVGERKK
ncbi:MAG: PKD domain-containing protein [Bacteroidales bacterium]|nr:PKD domain-containing protein [Bacteroidales bacterium]MCB9013220.1 PKD domain-containing protein [Bacteroidales bacterium]